MTDIWRKPSPGDPLTFPAELRAEMIDTIQYVRYLRRSESPSRDRMARDRGLVKIKNESGAAVDRFGVLGLDGYATNITPTANLKAWKNEPVLSGITPATPTHHGKFAVLVQPLADDAIGWGCISGIVPVQVSFTYSDTPYADVKNADDSMLLDAEGGMPVIAKESGTGTKWALVQLGVPFWPILRGKLDADLSSGSSATMSIWDGSTLADSGRNVTVYDGSTLAVISSGKKIASGTAITASHTSGKWYLNVPGACEVNA